MGLQGSKSMFVFALTIVIATFVVTSCSKGNVAGTVDDTDTKGGVATLYMPDGQPAYGASIKVLAIADGSVQAETVSDSAGRYQVEGLRGQYNILAKKDALVLFRDSVYIGGSLVGSDTLGESVEFKGKVILNFGDDPRTATVKVLGTNMIENLDDSGYFEINSLPEGKYQLELSTLLSGYVETYATITLKAGTNSTELFTIMYTGIPLVSGLSGVYDSTTNVVHLSWDQTQYRNIDQYVICRQDDTAKTVDLNPYALSSNSYYDDTISAYSSNSADTAPHTYKYRVRIRNMFGEEGNCYGYLRVNVCRSKISAASTLNNVPIKNPLMPDSEIVLDSTNRELVSHAKSGDSLIFKSSISTWSTGIRRVEWKYSLDSGNIATIKSTDMFYQPKDTSSGDTVLNRDTSNTDTIFPCSCTDSCTVLFSNTGSQDIYLVVTDKNGEIWTHRYYIWLD